MNERIKIEFQRTTDDLMSAWEIGKVVDGFGSYYYKFILFDELKKILNSGIDPSNIFILDKSFKLNNEYKSLHNDKNNKNIKHLYSTAGLPYSMRPSFQVEILRELFLSFRLCNEELFMIKSGRVSQNELEKIVKVMLSKNNKSVDELFIDIKKLCIVKINENKNSADSKSLKRVKERISKIIDGSIIKIRKFKDKDIEFNKILRSYKGEDENFDKTIENNYFKRFFVLFEKVNRPIICYFDKNNNIRVLAANHINLKKRDESFLDVIRIGHNSKLKTKVAGSVIGAIGSTIELLLDEKRKNEKHLKELERLSIEIETAEIKKLREKIGLIDDLVEMYNERNISVDMNVVGKIIGQDIAQIEKTLQNGTKNLIYGNKMKLINMNQESNFDEVG